MLKADLDALRADLVAEYRDYPNPTNDPIIAFEARAAELIGDLMVFATRENNERHTRPEDMVAGFAAVISIVFDQIATQSVDEHLTPALQQLAVDCLDHYLKGLSSKGGTTVPLPMKDVGDA